MTSSGLAAFRPRSLLWLPTAVGVLSLVLMVVAFSVPGGMLVTGLAAAIAFGVAVVLWAGSAVAVLRRHRRGAHSPLRSLVWLPLLGMLAAGLVVTGLPLTVAFAASRSALDATVAGVDTEPGSTGPANPGRIGLFDVTSVIRQDNGCVILAVRNAGFLDPEGLAHCPEPQGGGRGSDGSAYRHVDGSWYAWRGDF